MQDVDFTRSFTGGHESGRANGRKKAELQPSGLPVNAVLFIGFTMTTIVVHVKILTGGRERRMPEIVTPEPLGHVLQVAQLIQADRDNRRASGSPSRTNQGQAPKLKERKAGTKKQREITVDELNTAIGRTTASLQDSVLKTTSKR
ncbi:hypothetical protein AYM40_26845 [Paraburkholderia phytofirmans OLGA172]|uniref:Uncharacterized protein n=1 Tax=Paraburkholderia phytofirmans OLGA172 TaxID=1417228 RepID=A0A167WDD1_9BURK|nr:hypothetical protein [Paraburkholderia phytofirmans]ANB75917.1 hypothetical protein AYM40_26845 [Paraburkholderia phytofirmans OLGA172]